jgi:hypothetical protein
MKAMDALALLCNLHADGPATLQRLRRAGLESLGALRRIDALRLAEALGWAERSAERFLREAALLAERVDEQELEPASVEGGLEATLLEELDGPAALEEGEDEPSSADESEEPAVESAELPASAERIEAVLGAWRELDRLTPPLDPADFVIPRPPAPLDQPLAQAGLATLTPALGLRLAELGVATLRELLARDEFELMRALPLAYTRLHHLRQQAERRLQDLVASAPQVEPRQVFTGFAPPPSEPFETAGPFA